ncbi:uncharacterized protein NPIL_74091 [Nephila pilipes]|uniref:Uncharacterized protein n=1 Tax=Nephila pilipes TaxID=299642 RepID=A0A8X6P9G0_NEPPI|nr:uncharacterized protein NPIL_74091 [Nephila pilipes]
MIRQDNANESIRADDEFLETKGTPFSKARCPITGGEKAAAGERNDALSATEELPVSVKITLFPASLWVCLLLFNDRNPQPNPEKRIWVYGFPNGSQYSINPEEEGSHFGGLLNLR